jgi:hypothetical protein
MGGPVVSDGMLMFVFQCYGLVPLVSGICVLVVGRWGARLRHAPNPP